MQSPDSNEDIEDSPRDAETPESSASKSSGSSRVGGLSSVLLRLMGVKAADGRIILVSYPKIIFLYPTVMISLVCGITMSLFGGNTISPQTPVNVAEQAVASPDVDDATTDGDANAETEGAAAGTDDAEASDAAAEQEPAVASDVNATAEFCGRFFMFALLLNLVVIGFDFPRTASFTIFFCLVAVAALAYSMVRWNEAVMPALVSGIVGIKPIANATFYYAFFLGMTAMFGAVAVTRRFDYWEVSGNELLHHQGFLSNLKRYPSPNLRIDKEINDVFEFILLRSGRLILQPSNERKAIVLENVINISRKEERISSMLKQLDVRIR